MNKKFQKFVQQCLVRMNVSNEEYRFTKIKSMLTLFSLQRFEENEEQLEHVKFGKLLPAPKINLCFENGRVSYWNRSKC